MRLSTSRLERNIHRVAVIVGVLVALAIPCSYWLVAHQNLSDSLDFKARVKASALTDLIASNPELWMFAESRLQGLITRAPVPLAADYVQILNQHNAVITAAGATPLEPVLSRSHTLYDGERSVGRVVVAGTMQRLVGNTLLASLLGLMLGVVVYVAMKVLPLRALKLASNAAELAETTLSSIGEAVVTTDADGRITMINPVAEQMLGYRRDEATGQHFSDVIRLGDASSGGLTESSLQRTLRTNAVVSCAGSCEVHRRDGTRVAIEEHAAPVHNGNGTLSGAVLILRDVGTARQHLQRRSWEATHDPLTELFNRREFESRLQLALANTQATQQSHVLCYMDLDSFKLVNDVGGHSAGDELLIELAKLMLSRIRDTDTLARLGGDEFGLLLEHCSEQRGQLIAAEIVAAVNEFQFVFDARAFQVGVSIGLTAIDKEQTDVTKVIAEADCACYWAKQRGKNQVVTFVAQDMNPASRRSETGWVERINSAFKENRWVLFQQTYRALHASAGHDEHLEVLLRMIGENGEIVAPGSFLPAAERFNLMPEIDRWVIHEVFSRHAFLVEQRGGRKLACAINLSSASISSPGLPEFIRQQALEYKLEPGSICFELSAAAAFNNTQATAKFIGECKALGFPFGLDSFGTGTSSFSQLKNLPVDYLKIDGSFVKNIEHDSVDEAMVENIHRIGRLLGKLTVAEFAENEAIITKLATLGVDFAQGYGVGRPQPLFEHERLPEVLR